MRTQRVEAHADVIRGPVEETPDITLGRVLLTSARAVHRFLDLVAVAVLPTARDHTQVQTEHAIEQDHQDVLKRRLDLFAGRFDLNPDTRVLIDQTWTTTNMARIA